MFSAADRRGLELLVPDTVDVDGHIWHLVNRHDLNWGIQSGLTHFGELQATLGEEYEQTQWLVVASSRPYQASKPAFSKWSEAFEDFVHSETISAEIEREGDPQY
jgi:hypothetical protein